MAQPTTYPLLDVPKPIIRSAEDFDEDAMNVEKHTQSVAPMQVAFNEDMISRMIPPLLTKGQHGLSSLSQKTLQQNLEPIMNALQRLDAELLLDLQPTKEGPQVHAGYVSSSFCVSQYAGSVELETTRTRSAKYLCHVRRKTHLAH